MIDLHTHSTYSDGTYSPKDLIELAYKNGIKAIAITDHDTIEGISYAKEKAKELNIELINGVEFSANYKGIEIHILGYFLDITNKNLLNLLKDLEKTRNKRNLELIEKLNNIGLDISFDYVKSLSGSGLITKAHFATALVKKGYAKTRNDAFSLYLGKGKPAYVQRVLISYKDAINFIHNANGISVLAHPIIYKLSEMDLELAIKDLKHSGLNGIECYYPSNTLKQTNFLLSLAKKYNLKVTGGSDFHGENRPNVSLGNIFLEKQLDYKILEDLKSIRR
ncbi:PHP domain-containing protein [uncultured Tyzzerella sp.]|uniref:PHP domain-containing protein n=1 Tax=uncultured Tyzzerella sp. TaxID=2321398 RepID=UPI002943D6C1|nr:PHP domain-containing protein [uncultured Tyzzerella sp.]